MVSWFQILNRIGISILGPKRACFQKLLICLTLFWFLLIFIDFGSRLERFLDPKSFLHEKGDHVGSIFDYFVSIVIDLGPHLGSFWTQPPPNRLQDVTNCKKNNKITLHENGDPALTPVGSQFLQNQRSFWSFRSIVFESIVSIVSIDCVCCSMALYVIVSQ